jgi:transitional endoplasmic reticulum ATPase
MSTTKVKVQSQEISPPVDKFDRDILDITKNGVTKPDSMDWVEASRWCDQRAEEEDQVIQPHRDFKCFPMEGALALGRAIERQFGFAKTGKKTWFGELPPKLIDVEVSAGKFQQATWGQFTLPNTDEGKIETSPVVDDNSLWTLRLTANIRRKHMSKITELFEILEAELAENSIYRGKAMYIDKILDTHKEFDPTTSQPKFVPGLDHDKQDLILPDQTRWDIEAGVFLPIEKPEKWAELGIPTKRAVLLAGTFGVGKTLTANIAANLASKHNRTTLYLKDLRRLPQAVEFGRRYGSCLIFCEDIDRHLSGERTESVDQILNVIDGIDSKRLDTLFIFTTNNPNDIHEAFLRSGRSDMVIHIPAPDAQASGRLIQRYLNGRNPVGLTLEKLVVTIGERCAKIPLIPADLREVAERSKAYALAAGREIPELKDIERSARGVIIQAQDRMGSRTPKPKLETVGMLMREVAEKPNDDVGEMLKNIHNEASNATRQIGLLADEVDSVGYSVGEVGEAVQSGNGVIDTVEGMTEEIHSATT